VTAPHDSQSPAGLFRVALSDGTTRLARGPAAEGPTELLGPGLTFDGLLGSGAEALGAALDSAAAGPAMGLPVLAPIESAEVWCAGVTYERSRDARVEESAEPSVYDRVYAADRPELFFKAPGWRVRGPGEPIGIRADSAWNVPEAELAVVVASDGRICGFTIGNDMSSRSIEGENPLYLPQAKVYDWSCALGPCIVPATEAGPSFAITMEVRRGDEVAFRGATGTEQMKRTFADLASYLGRALTFPVGAIVLTGTGLVPDAPFTLEPGDVVRIEIDGLGVLENPVAAVGAHVALEMS
jgi:2-dehydro-3-deoxy-D-arabinonate dehydratase